MYQEPEMIYRTAQRQTMTDDVPPISRCVDSDRRSSVGWLGAIGEIAGTALLEWLASPVLGIAVLVVSYCLEAIWVISDLCRQGANALNRKTRKAQE